MRVDSLTVADLIKPIYVRTTKRELDIPDVDRKLISLDLSPVQAKLYALMRSEVARVTAEHALSIRSRIAFRSLGRSIMRLLQVVSNPALLTKEIGFAHEGLLGEVLEEGKHRRSSTHACAKAARTTREEIADLDILCIQRGANGRTVDIGAVFIHGGVDAGDEDDEDTREGKIKAFHDDATIRVMVANPAAASEGISLHTVCQNAIYVDRTFNAALSAIRRQDPPAGTSQGSGPDGGDSGVSWDEIDEIVRLRLGLKIDRMSAVLEDPSLNVDPIPFDSAALDAFGRLRRGNHGRRHRGDHSRFEARGKRMINLSPGLLYSAQKLVETVSTHPMDRDEYLWSFRTILVSPADGVLALATRCGWIGINEHLGLDVTEMGRKVQSLPDVEEKLRQQIKDFIQAVQPAWANLVPAGRAESLPFMPEPARQCFVEAGLGASPPSDAVISWW